MPGASCSSRTAISSESGSNNSVDNLPALPEGSAIVYGHTHVKVNEEVRASREYGRSTPGA